MSFLQIHKAKQKDNILAKDNNNKLPIENKKNNNIKNKLIQLQQTLGNQVVQRMIKSNKIQAKLKVSQPDDPYEKEADKVAEQVMRMSDLHEAEINISDTDLKNKIQTKCDKCKMKPEEEKDEIKINRKLHHQLSFQSNIETSDETTNEIYNTIGGKPLDDSIRTFMETKFNHDFSNVRVHDDSKSQQLSKSVNGRAFTYRNKIFLGSNESASDKKLMAHELTHVIQQNKIHDQTQTKKTSSNDDTVKIQERDADNVQRIEDPIKKQPTMLCPVALSSPTNVMENFTFAVRGSTLSALQLAQIQHFVNLWHVDGSNAIVRVDGFASVDGPESLNWVLSCDRAIAVATELHTPSNLAPGIPVKFITFFAHGETNEFSSNELNRRATISANIAIPPPTSICTLTGFFKSIPSGTLTATLIGNKLGAIFFMIGEFVSTSRIASCTCSCGEYRQFIRGIFKFNGVTQTLDLCGTNLDPITFHEDCSIRGGIEHKYGYRAHRSDTSNFTTPNQATGCKFVGSDYPGIKVESSGTSGAHLEMDVDFIGKLVDTCNGEKELARSTWSVKGTGIVP